MAGWNGYSEQGTGSEERGPASFTLQVPGVVGADAGAAGQAVAVRGGMEGSTAGVTSKFRTDLPAYEDPTTALLLKMGEKIVGRKVNQMRDEQFLRGVQQAASGKALVDIVNEQPWYTQIFGDVPMVEGARAYDAQTRAARWASETLTNMSKLREVSPDALPKLIMEDTNKRMSGDMQGDLMFRAEVLKRLPGLIEQHTKEHYKWGQEQLRNKAYDNINAASIEAQQILSNPDPAVSSPEARAAVRDRLFSAFTPPPGMDAEAAENMVVDGLVGAAQSGNWHAVGILKESGALAYLKPDKRQALENAIRIQADRHRTQSPEALPFNIKTAVLYERAQNDPNYTAEQFLADAQKLNDEFSKQTGNPAPLITNLEMARGAGTAIQAVYNMLRVSQRSASTGDDKEAKHNLLVQEALKGTLGYVVKGPDVSGPEADRAFVAAINLVKEQDPVGGSEKQARIIIENSKYGYINPIVKAEWTAGLAHLGDEPTTSFQNAYSKWKELRKHPDSQAARAGYFGSDLDARLERYDTLMRTEPKDAIFNYRAAMLSPTLRRALNKDGEKALDKLIDDKVGRNWLIGDRKELGTSLSPASKRLVRETLRAAAEAYNGMAPELGMDEIGRRAFEEAKQKGLEVYGGFAWQGTPGQVPLTQTTGMTPAALDEAVQAVVKKHTPGIDGDLYLSRLRDADGKAVFEGWYRDDRGQSRRVYFTSDELVNYQSEKLKPKPPRDLTFGPKITFPQPTRSPYAK